MSGGDHLEEIELTVTDSDRASYKRLDQWLTDKTDFSRSFIKKLFEAENISADINLSLNKMPQIGTVVSIDVPPPIPLEAKAQNIPLEILFQDEHLAVINKPAGLVVHPAPGHPDGTLVNAILYHCPDLSGVGGTIRPGIVHRLDKGTSGVMVVAKSQAAHEGLVLLFSTHDIDREYEALVIYDQSRLPKEGKLESTIGRDPKNRQKMASNVRGKNAITHFKVESYRQGLAHVICRLETGRTHQIRVHLSQLLNCPILNDPTYGDQARHRKRLNGEHVTLVKEYEHPFLHARRLGFTHPITGERIDYTVAPPPLFQKLLDELP